MRLCSVVRSQGIDGKEVKLSDSWVDLPNLSSLHRARIASPHFAALFHLDEEYLTSWVFLDLDEIVLLQIQLQDRVFDGGEDEANVLRVWKMRGLLFSSLMITPRLDFYVQLPYSA